MEINELLRKYQKPVLTIAYRMLGNWEDARDATQETFIRYWQSKQCPQDPDAVFNYLARIVTNRCIDQLRRKKRIHFLPLRLDLMRHEDSNEEKTEENQIQDLILRMADRLKPKQKAVFILRDVENYSVRETAVILDETENRVRVNLHLARKNMKKWLKPWLSP